MNSHCPHFSPWLRHGIRFVFVDGPELSQWISAPQNTLERHELIESIDDLSSRLAEEAMEAVLSEDSRLMSGFDDRLAEEAHQAIKAKIATSLKRGAPTLQNLDRSHNEEVKKMTRLFAHEIARTVCECAKKIAELQAKVGVDPLTGLPHRGALDQRLAEEVARSDRDGPLSLMIFDLDRFKEINDSHGHLMGDEVLRELANRFRTGEIGQKIMRESDFVARYGGDEMVFLFPNTSEEGAVVAAHRIVESVKQTPFFVSDGRGGITMVDLSASIGISSFEGRDKDPDGNRMIDRADQCLYVLKGERPDSHGIRKERRGRIAVNGRVLDPLEIDEMIRQKKAEESARQE